VILEHHTPTVERESLNIASLIKPVAPESTIILCDLLEPAHKGFADLCHSA
jgi:hypothetical protein